MPRVRVTLTVREPEVLKVDIRFGEQRARGPDEGIHELVVPLPADALLPQAQVQFVAEELLVVRPAVKHDRQGAVRVNAGAERGEH